MRGGLPGADTEPWAPCSQQVQHMTQLLPSGDLPGQKPSLTLAGHRVPHHCLHWKQSFGHLLEQDAALEGVTPQLEWKCWCIQLGQGDNECGSWTAHVTPAGHASAPCAYWHLWPPPATRTFFLSSRACTLCTATRSLDGSLTHTHTHNLLHKGIESCAPTQRLLWASPQLGYLISPSSSKAYITPFIYPPTHFLEDEPMAQGH